MRERLRLSIIMLNQKKEFFNLYTWQSSIANGSANTRIAHEPRPTVLFKSNLDIGNQRFTCPLPPGIPLQVRVYLLHLNAERITSLQLFQGDLECKRMVVVVNVPTHWTRWSPVQDFSSVSLHAFRARISRF